MNTNRHKFCNLGFRVGGFLSGKVDFSEEKKNKNSPIIPIWIKKRVKLKIE
jgi:hypothetical protein